MNITYLLGAGASFNALPVVNQITEKLQIFYRVTDFKGPNIGIEDFDTKYGGQRIDGDNSPLKRDVMNELNDSIQWLMNENSKHFSIDTFAKKLYLQKEFKQLHRLKLTLSCFFVYLQNTKLDYRYDSLFASILDDLNSLPVNLKFLSWNYDYQMEIAFSNFIKNKRLSDNQRVLNVCSKGIKSPIRGMENVFGIYKLNGTTSLKDKDQPINILDNINEDSIDILNEIVTYYHYSIKQSIPTTVSFAWEEDNDNYIQSVCSCIKDTDIIIVIGYSFPFFNRKIDQKILRSIPSLKKIYIQDPYQAESVKERINSLLSQSQSQQVEFAYVGMTDQFYIPFEF